MLKVYVAGALSGKETEYIKNMHRMIKWANKVRKIGFAVFVPGLDFLMGVVVGDMEYSDYFDNGQPWLRSSDAVFLVPGWKESEGTSLEVYEATLNHIPTYETLEELKAFKKSKEKQ